MNVLIIGNTQNCQRFEERFGSGHNLITRTEPQERIRNLDLIVWYGPLNNPGFLRELDGYGIPILIDSTFTSLAILEEQYGPVTSPLFGFTSLPGFFERPVFEVSALKSKNISLLESLMNDFSTEYEIVADQTGLVSPRVIAMIINEAFHTAGEGIASREDIDTAMKLGTNYPKGPFEWAKEIGIQNIFNLLNAIYANSGEKRYRPSPLLKEEASSSRP